MMTDAEVNFSKPIDPDTYRKTVIYMHDVKILILLTNPNQPLSTLFLAHLPKFPCSSHSLSIRVGFFRRSRRDSNLNFGCFEICCANGRQTFNRSLGLASCSPRKLFATHLDNTRSVQRLLLGLHGFPSFLQLNVS